MKPKRFHTWFVPLFATLLIFIGGVASNWVAADLQDNLEPYRPWVWTLFVLALLTTLFMAWRETRSAEPEPTLADQPKVRIGHDQIGGDKAGGNVIKAEVSESENTVIGANNVQTVIQQAVFNLAQQVQSRTLTTEQARSITTAYLEQVVNRYRYLDFKGMGVTDRVALQLPLLEMYVPLRARRELPAGDTTARSLRLAGRAVSEAEAAEMGQHLSEPQPVIDLLQAHAGVIVLGDPGAGKTTFLKYLALLLAFDQGERIGLAGYLPVLIPLAAYANRLEQGDVALQDFLGDYYRSLGIPLPIGDLLSAVLTQGRALLLMDGLDEVQSLLQRTTLVKRFEEFFAFHRKTGNKFVLTSRIVGYRDLRPSAPGLLEATLVDFDEHEIAQFVGKWSQAVERAV